jgi:hypothetical protein
MILQTVGGVKRGEFRHGAITRDLGDDGRGGDGGAAGIAVDDGDFGAGEARLLVAIDEAEVRLQREARHGAAHGEQARAENIVGLDFLHRGDADGPAHVRVGAEEGAQLDPAFGLELFGIVEVFMRQAIRQNRCRRKDRPRPATAPDFIHAGDDGHALGSQAALEFPAERIAAFAGWHGLIRFLVLKFHLGTLLVPAKFYFALTESKIITPRSAIKLPQQVRSQVKLGNEKSGLFVNLRTVAECHHAFP